ncbi:MAG TPA: UrcA family protein [Caulobacteraceae bacterium]
MSQNIPFVVVALVLGAASGSVSAEPKQNGSPVTVRVPIGDLDLNREADADKLLKRVSAAASLACSGPPAAGVMMAEIARAYRACKVQALERAVAQINSPMVRLAEAKR